MKISIVLLLIFNIVFVGSQCVLSADLEAGEKIFSANCSACHAGGNNAIMPEKTLKDDALTDNNMKSVSAITTQVKNGKNAMPAFGGRLADEDIENVANYVLNQAKDNWGDND